MCTALFSGGGGTLNKVQIWGGAHLVILGFLQGGTLFWLQGRKTRLLFERGMLFKPQGAPEKLQNEKKNFGNVTPRNVSAHL